MKHLFDENEQYSQRAVKFGDDVRRTLEPLLEELKDEGFSLRDAHYIIEAEAAMAISAFIVRREIARRKKEKDMKVGNDA